MPAPTLSVYRRDNGSSTDRAASPTSELYTIITGDTYTVTVPTITEDDIGSNPYSTIWDHKGPLTTPFSAPTTCSSLTQIPMTINFESGVVVGRMLFRNLPPETYERLSITGITDGQAFQITSVFQPDNCYPPGYFTHYTSGKDDADDSLMTTEPYYSPAICPQGWPSAPINTSSGLAESTAACCPPSYTYIDYPATTYCRSALSEPKLAYVIDQNGTMSAGLVSNAEATAKTMQIRWKAEDFPSQQAENGTQPSNQGHSNRSSNIAAAISISLLILLAIGIGGFFLLRRMRRSHKQHELEPAEHFDKPELDGTSRPMVELPSNDFTTKIELNGESFPEPIELEGSGLVELSGNSVPRIEEETKLERPPL